MKRIALAFEIAVIVWALSGCMNPYKPMAPLPGVLTPPPASMALNPAITDYDGMVYAEGVKAVLAGRTTNLERGDLALALTGSALASGAGMASASGASAGVMAALISVGSMLGSLTAVVNPATRANALSEGNNATLRAESRYLLCISGAGITRVSKSILTPCGAQLIADVNSAIAATNRILVGLMPNVVDTSRIQGANPSPAVPAPVVSAVNKEAAASQP